MESISDRLGYSSHGQVEPQWLKWPITAGGGLSNRWIGPDRGRNMCVQGRPPDTNTRGTRKQVLTANVAHLVTIQFCSPAECMDRCRA